MTTDIHQQRAPFQVLIVPFRATQNGFEFCVFKRSDYKYWQFVAGGGQGQEIPTQAAQREFIEETGCCSRNSLWQLQTITSVPKVHFRESTEWPQSLYVIPEYAFAVECHEHQFSLSREHSDFHWDQPEKIRSLLQWDSNRTALWELNERLKSGDWPA